MIHENGEPIDSDKKHIDTKLLDEYRAKLSINDKVPSDPINMKEGKVREKASIKFWSQVYLTDLRGFYCDVLDKKEII